MPELPKKPGFYAVKWKDIGEGPPIDIVRMDLTSSGERDWHVMDDDCSLNDERFCLWIDTSFIKEVVIDHFIRVEDALPSTEHGSGLVSRPILFKVDNKDWAGFYHCNGFFYTHEWRMKSEESMADGPNIGRHSSAGRKATHWRYLRDE